MTTTARPPRGRATERWRSHLLTTFSGNAAGTPEWIAQIADGDDEGLFGPESAVWVVNGGISTIVAGIRALLVQALHPGAMAGVHDHSRYREDPLGRLAGTVRWVTLVTFGSTATARTESERVERFHRRVRGEYVDGGGTARPYAAEDPDLLAWVHIAFTQAFLGCHETWGGRIPGGADAYVREWAAAGELVGVADPPRSAAELRAAMDAYRTEGVLRRDERVDEAVRFIRRPPLAPGMMPAYRVLFAGAVASLPPEYRRLLGLRRSPLPVIWATGAVLRLVGWVLGGRSTSELLARERIARLRAT